MLTRPQLRDAVGYSSISPGSQVLKDPYLSGSHIVSFQWIFKSEPIFDIYSSPAFRICNHITKKFIKNSIFDGLKMKKKKKVIFFLKKFITPSLVDSVDF